MKLELDVDVTDLGTQLAKGVLKAMSGAVDESIRYGSFGREVKDATNSAALMLVREVLADPGFRAEARLALTRGIVRGIEARGEKIAKGMPLQQALDLAKVNP